MVFFVEEKSQSDIHNCPIIKKLSGVEDVDQRKHESDHHAEIGVAADQFVIT